MPLTEAQQNALPAVRDMFNSVLPPLGTAPSLDERARYPENLPPDITARVEIAPPSSHLHPLLPSSAQRTPERVPVYFYALRSDQTDPGPELADTRVIFFIHGGGNVVGHPTLESFVEFYVQLLRVVAKDSGDARNCVLIAPCYRLATVPQNAFPAALQDLVAAYDYVLDKGYRASNIVIAGDSAGGNHAIVLTHLILHLDGPSPHGVISIAPFSIQAPDCMSEGAKAQASADVINSSSFGLSTSAYVGDSGVALTDPLVSGSFIPFTASWPKTLILIGTADQLIDGSHTLEKRLAALKLPVELVEYDERPHGWWVLPHIFQDDVQDAAQRIAHFILY